MLPSMVVWPLLWLPNMVVWPLPLLPNMVAWPLPLLPNLVVRSFHMFALLRFVRCGSSRMRCVLRAWRPDGGASSVRTTSTPTGAAPNESGYHVAMVSYLKATCCVVSGQAGRISSRSRVSIMLMLSVCAQPSAAGGSRHCSIFRNPTAAPTSGVVRVGAVSSVGLVVRAARRQHRRKLRRRRSGRLLDCVL